jgi:hypothetical protein
MSTRRSVAVMGVRRPAYFNQVLMRANTVVFALTNNASIFTTPDPALAVLIAQAAMLQGYINDVNDGDHSKIGLRNEASVKLYDMLREELVYINKIGNHNRGLLEQSGFAVNAMPEPQSVPPQVIIKRIVDGYSSNTAKIFIYSLHMRYLIYIVEQSTTPDEETSWKPVLNCTNSGKLFIKNLKRGEEVWFRVCAQSSGGRGQWSNNVYFISRN